MSDSPILLTVSDGHAEITLNRPDRLNALTRQLMLALGAALSDVAARDDIRVVTLAGAGRAFSAGQDLSERDPRKLAGPLDLGAIQRELFHPVIRAITTMDKLVVARVGGIAAGAGAAIALSADVVIASTDAKFALSFSKIGLSVDAGLGRTLALGLGPAKARALLFTGATLSASDAEAAGLIWKAVPLAQLAESHASTVADLVATPRRSIAGIKRAISAAHESLDDYLEIEAEAQAEAGRHPDYAEGVLSFLEKRPAKFS